MAGVFLNEVEKRLRELPEVRELDVSMDTETLWTPQLMTQEYRVRLETVRKARRIA
jgi:metal-sulfur cluster biosynthetic enzyme